MRVGAFITGASDDHQKTQRKRIKALLRDTGANVKWYTEPEGRQRRDVEDRGELNACVRYCRTNDATLALHSISDLFPKKWQALTFLKHQVEMYDIDVKVADDPIISKGSLHVLSAAADAQRHKIAKKSKQAIESIKAKLEEEGSYTARNGRTITRLGIHDKLPEAGVKGNEAQAELARERDDEVWPIIERCQEQGMGYAATARHLNALGILTPAARARHERATNMEWYASTVRNIVLRRSK